MKEDELCFVGQKAFIEKDGQLLIINEPTDGLDFPGGKIQQGERVLSEALKREVREETGLEIEVGQPFVAWWTDSRKFPGKRIFLVGYRCQYQSGEVILSSEHNNFKWINASNYGQLDNDNPYFKIVETYFNQNKK